MANRNETKIGRAEAHSGTVTSFSAASSEVVPARVPVVSVNNVPPGSSRSERRASPALSTHSISVPVTPDGSGPTQYFRKLRDALRIDTDPDPQVQAENRAARKALLREAKEDPEFDEAQETLVVTAYEHRAARVTAQGVEAHEYFRTFGQILREEPDHDARRAFASEEKEGDEFKTARATLRGEDSVEITSEGTNEIPVLQIRSQRTEVDLVFDVDRDMKRQQDIVWAHQVIAEASYLPRTVAHDTDVKSRGEYIEDVATGLWKDPDRLETALRIWKAQGDVTDVYIRTKDIVEKDVRFHWQDVSKEHLASFVTVNAREGYVGEEFGDILRSYFAGPATPAQRINAYYTFAESAVTLVDDAEAMKRAAKIGVYETDIVPRNGEYLRDIYITHLLAFYDPEIQMKARVAGFSVMNTLARVSGLDFVSIKEKNDNEFQAALHDPNIQRRRRRMLDLSAEQNPTEYFKMKNFTIPEIGEVLHGATSAEDVFRMLQQESSMTDKPTSEQILALMQKFVSNSPLYDELMDKTHSRVVGRMQRTYASEELRNAGEVPTFISIRIPGSNCVMEICMPSSLVGDRRDIIETFRSDEKSIEEISSGKELFITSGFTVDGKSVKAWYRGPDSSEAARHEIEALNAIGFPEVTSDDIQVDNTQLANAIEEQQTRFTTPQGFRVPLKHPALTSLGYEHITFQKDADKQRSMNVTIRVEGMDVRFKLDKDFRLDLEGKPADIASIAPSIHNVLLSVLYPALCEKHAQDEHGNPVEIAKLLTARVGYIGFLREGFNFSSDQSNYLLEDEGLDLATVSERRKVNGETRNSTYYRPILPEDPTLPPVTMYIPLPEDMFATSAVEAKPQRERVVFRSREEIRRAQAHPLGLSEHDVAIAKGYNQYYAVRDDIRTIRDMDKNLERKRALLVKDLYDAEKANKPTVAIRKELKQLLDDEIATAQAIQSLDDSVRNAFDGTPMARSYSFKERQHLPLDTVLQLLGDIQAQERQQSNPVE